MSLFLFTLRFDQSYFLVFVVQSASQIREQLSLFCYAAVLGQKYFTL